MFVVYADNHDAKAENMPKANIDAAIKRDMVKNKKLIPKPNYTIYENVGLNLDYEEE